MATQFLPDAAGRTDRPPLVTVLGIVSFINTGIFIIAYALAALVFAALKEVPFEEFEATANEALAPVVGGMSPEEAARIPEILRIFHGSGALLCMILLLRTVMRLVGVVGIWRGRRSGFFTYAFAQIGGIFAPLLVLPIGYVGLFGPLLALGTTALYGTQLKRLN